MKRGVAARKARDEPTAAGTIGMRKRMKNE